MKRIALVVMAMVLAVGVFTGCTSNSKQEEASTAALTIKDIQTDPLSFTGEITLTGISVGQFQDDPQVFFVMDTAELLVCKDMQCGAFQLPAIYKGDAPMPEVADEVDITGSWGKYETGTQSVDVFEVKEIKVKRNVMDLLTK